VDDKIKILIVSVLKPADDVRSYHKIGKSLAQTNKYEVNIIGFDSKMKAKEKNISLHPIFKFKRNSISRLFAPIKVLRKYIELKPKLIIVNTPELLSVMMILKILFGTKIIYDVQENYQLNVKYSTLYSAIKKRLISTYLSTIENLSKYFTSGYLLAEEVYEKQLEFIDNQNYITVLNKSILPVKTEYKPIHIIPNHPINLVISGTLGREYGILEGIEYCKYLNKNSYNVTLDIIGYSADNQYLEKIQNSIKNLSFINDRIENKPVPQQDIIEVIKKADMALLPYQINPNLKDRFPTKIYDYIALGIPMIIPKNANWANFLSKYPASASIDFNSRDKNELKDQLDKKSFYVQAPGKEIQWVIEEKKLVNFIEKILTK